MVSSEGVSKQEGLRLLKAGQVGEAIEVLEKAKSIDPDDPEILTYLGAAYNQNNDRLHAIAAFEQAVQLQESPRSYYNLGLMYETVHRIDEAIRQYNMALELDPNYSHAQEAMKKLKAQFAAAHPEQQPQDEDEEQQADADDQ